MVPIIRRKKKVVRLIEKSSPKVPITQHNHFSLFTAAERKGLQLHFKKHDFVLQKVLVVVIFRRRRQKNGKENAS